MSEALKLMCVLAHPDDESLGLGATLAKYRDEGVSVSVVTATRGERGRFFDDTDRPSMATIGNVREQELRNAIKILGVDRLHLLNYLDGDLDKADPKEAIAKIVDCIRAERPQVIVTFAPDGGYGHPDHIAISQFTAAAIVAAADSTYTGRETFQIDRPAHRVAKLYFMTWTESSWQTYQRAFKDLRTTVDGVERRATPFPDWAVTTRVNTSNYLDTVWRAVQCHKTQLTIYRTLDKLGRDDLMAIWGEQSFYRVFSTVNGGRTVETDLFEGLREPL